MVCSLLVLLALVPRSVCAPQGLIAVAAGDASTSIELVDAGGRYRRFLTRNAPSAVKLQFSADRRLIAFTPVERSPSLGISYGLAVMRRDGAGQRRLSRDACGTRDWSPRGERLAFIDEKRGLVVYDARAARELSLDRRADPCSEVAWSPDGRKLAYTRPDGVYVRTLTGRPLRVARMQWALVDAWSPRGDALLVSEPTPQFRAWRLEHVSLRPRSVRRLVAASDAPSARYTARGDVLVDASERTRSDCVRWMIMAPAATFRDLPFPACDYSQVVASPDGTRFAGVAKGRLRIAARDGHFVDLAPADDVTPAWSPDGRRLAFVRTGDAWVITSPNGPPRPLTHLGFSRRWRTPDEDIKGPFEQVQVGELDWATNDDLYAVVDSDSNSAPGTDKRTETSDVLRLSLDGHKRSFPPSTSDSDPAWSPDGTTLAFIRRRFLSHDLLIVDRGTGRTHRVARHVSAFNWVGSRRIAIVDDCFSPWDTKSCAEHILDLRSSRIVRLRARTPIAWSSDGRRLLEPLAGADYCPHGVIVARRDGSHRRIVLRGPYKPVGFGPGGSIIILQEHGPDCASGAILILRKESRRPRVLVAANPAYAFAQLAVSPSGRYVTFVDNEDRLHVRDLASRRTTTLGEGLDVLAWSPDGHWLALAQDQFPKPPALFLERPDGSGRRRFMQNAPEPEQPVLSWAPHL